ncbi:Bifunctional uridylyltransferase/uridylyl-removing enzyme [Stieleria maiorica]|uniref:Bifunctional uridylyltransferase/uridylyl-removing enzyme n=1 Tax=Stieleria maiorica TaxID=2795974 RepID=A0A5B9MJQ3_9BACT|nr:hypothetical protein [Stieleria maiorica]QEG01104.1 Bifunctional uridylyltransferase/uridylyl-removing enzyme [Stieleria maiorica]
MNTPTNENDGFQGLAWVRALREGLQQSDQRMRLAGLADGWALVNYRGRVIREAMKCFYERVIAEAPPRGSIVVYGLGGTGRREICPGSDVDIGIIVENIEDNQHFLRHLSSRLRSFARRVPGLRSVVKANAFPDLKDREHFDLKSLVALLDSDLLIGDSELDHRIRRVCRGRAAELGLDFIFAINQDFRRFDQLYPQSPGDIGGFHVKNGKGGLRGFQMAMWLYSFERWIPSLQVYQQVRSTRRFDREGAPSANVLEAVGVLFSTRCWIEQRRAAQTAEHSGGEKLPPPLFMDVSDMEAFLHRFGAGGLTQLRNARDVIDSYRHETMDRLLERGVVVPDTDGLVVWGSDGLRISADALFKDATEMFFSLYHAQQRFLLPIDRAVKRAARKNISESLRPDPALIKLMISPGPVYPAIKDWFEFGVLEKLVPGFGELFHQLYQPGHRAATLTRAARAVQRIQGLEYLDTLKRSEITSSDEAYFLRQYQDIGDSGRGALRLALLTDEIPQTLYPTNAPPDPSGYDAQTYGDSVRRYVSEYLSDVPGLSGPTLRTIEFLLLKKRELLKWAEAGSRPQVLESWRREIDQLHSRDSADTIRALALFAYAAFDYHNPEGVPRIRLEPEQWQKIQNLTQNLLHGELGVGGRPFEDHYFDPTGQRIGALLPHRLLASPHVDNSLRQTYEGTETLDPQRAHRIIFALTAVVQTGRPKVELKRDGDFYRLTLYSWDFPGLFWRVAGALYEMGCAIRSTDLYEVPDPSGRATDGESLMPGERHLIVDVLTFDATEVSNEAWEDEVRRRIQRRLENPNEPLADQTAEILKPVLETLCPSLTDLGDGRIKFSCNSPQSNQGTRYAVSRLLSERAGASIESIVRDGTRDWPVPRMNFYVRVGRSVEAVAEALRDDLGDVTIETEEIV